jgi:hypothetical protein
MLRYNDRSEYEWKRETVTEQGNAGGGDRFDVVWPLAPTRKAAAAVEQVERSDQMNGRRIGLLWDYLFRGDEIFQVVKQEVAARYADVTFIEPDVFGNLHGHDEDEVIARLPDVLRRSGVDSVIAAVGA